MKSPALKFCFTLALGIVFASASAQQATTASGGDATGSGGSVAYSIGQPVYTTHSGSSGTVAQGVQQPYEIFIIVGAEEKNINLFLSVYPNPTENMLALSVENYQDEQLTYQLLDLAGKILSDKKLTGNKTEISLREYSLAVYFLKVFEKENEIKSFRIVKN